MPGLVLSLASFSWPHAVTRTVSHSLPRSFHACETLWASISFSTEGIPRPPDEVAACMQEGPGGSDRQTECSLRCHPHVPCPAAWPTSLMATESGGHSPAVVWRSGGGHPASASPLGPTGGWPCMSWCTSSPMPPAPPLGPPLAHSPGTCTCPPTSVLGFSPPRPLDREKGSMYLLWLLLTRMREAHFRALMERPAHSPKAWTVSSMCLLESLFVLCDQAQVVAVAEELAYLDFSQLVPPRQLSSLPWGTGPNALAKSNHTTYRFFRLLESWSRKLCSAHLSYGRKPFWDRLCSVLRWR